MKKMAAEDASETPEQERLERKAGIREDSPQDRALGSSKSKFLALAKKMPTRRI